MALTSKDRDFGAAGLRNLKKCLDARKENTRILESPGEQNASRSLNSVRAIAKPVIALLEGLVTQTVEEEEEGGGVDASEGGPMTAFANKRASVHPRPRRNPLRAKKLVKRNETF